MLPCLGLRPTPSRPRCVRVLPLAVLAAFLLASAVQAAPRPGRERPAPEGAVNVVYGWLVSLVMPKGGDEWQAPGPGREGVRRQRPTGRSGQDGSTGKAGGTMDPDG